MLRQAVQEANGRHLYHKECDDSSLIEGILVEAYCTLLVEEVTGLVGNPVGVDGLEEAFVHSLKLFRDLAEVVLWKGHDLMCDLEHNQKLAIPELLGVHEFVSDQSQALEQVGPALLRMPGLDLVQLQLAVPVKARPWSDCWVMAAFLLASSVEVHP